MRHNIPISQLVEDLGPQVKVMAQAVESCVHCGFCLPVCPTYAVLGEEMDSPRGRILLMKSVLEGELTFSETMPYIDRCLGCLACVTACPSGVQYGDLVSPFRAYARSARVDGWMERVQHQLVHRTLPYPQRFRSAVAAGRLARPLQAALPEELQALIALLPERLPKSPQLPARMPAQGERRARVALLTGCVQQVLAPEINWASLRVLARNGVEVVIPPDQVCCGALPMHTGEREQALTLARQNLQAFPQDVDAIITNAAGCGSGMKEYALLFMGLPEEDAAQRFAAKVQDISQFLDELGLRETPGLPQALKVAYHDACHLAHAQGVRLQPRRLLSAIPGLTLLEIADGDTCCGSAGTYNLEQPEIAAALGDRKVGDILATGAGAVVAGNIGCIVHLRNRLQAQEKMLPVFHTLELLDLAYSSEQSD